jgi:hypothetical protein
MFVILNAVRVYPIQYHFNKEWESLFMGSLEGKASTIEGTGKNTFPLLSMMLPGL